MPKQTVPGLTNPDLALIARTSASLKTLEDELNQIFPQRTGVIRQAILALTMRDHLLIHGDTGTAKSLLARAIFGINDAADATLRAVGNLSIAS